jgi:DNA-binding NarL/FixJ family response regulator
MIRILIADDHALVRDCLRQLLSQTHDLCIVSEANDGMQALDKANEDGLDLVLLDMSMPGLGGADLVKLLRRQNAGLPILVLSMYKQPMLARNALAAGASGYLTKGCGAEVLISAIRTVALGGKYIDPGIAEYIVFNGFPKRELPPDQKLSKRERSILGMLARGQTVNEIASELELSNKTVSCYKTRLMNKMNFANIADLMRYAFSTDVV